VRFRTSAQRLDGSWANLTILGDERLSACKAVAREAWATEEYAFVCIYNGLGKRRWWLGATIRVRDTLGTIHV